MSRFEFEVKEDEASHESVLFFSGVIDESVTFENVKIPSDGKVRINLEGLTAINSCGIREWIRWIKDAAHDRQVILEKCPKVIVDQINLVAGFIPPHGIVESFYVPYCCESIGTEKEILFRRGIEFKEGQIFPPQKVLCDETQKEMEMDVIVDKYFMFIKSGIGQSSKN